MSRKRGPNKILDRQLTTEAHTDLLRVAKLAAGLNEHSKEIGPGMMAELTSTARAALAKASI
jgi:hypothetical protein